MGWTYDGSHPATVIFTEALASGAPFRFEPGMRILEIGCAEHDWLSPASEAWPGVEFVGIDWNVPTNDRPGVRRITANAMDPWRFAPETFDGIVALSSLEHIGLGHYGTPPDPVDPDGDRKTVANAWRWLKPGGWFYFDVPYRPTGYLVMGTSHRVYDHHAISERLISADRISLWTDATCAWRGWADKHGHLCAPIKTTTESVDGFDLYVAMLWQKPT